MPTTLSEPTWRKWRRAKTYAKSAPPQWPTHQRRKPAGRTPSLWEQCAARRTAQCLRLYDTMAVIARWLALSGPGLGAALFGLFVVLKSMARR